jgi:Flp pilus assembly protein TadG
MSDAQTSATVAVAPGIGEAGFKGCKAGMSAINDNGHERDRSAANGVRACMRRAAMRIAVQLSGCCHGDEGSTLIEMALVLPVLLVVLTGIFSFGIELNQYLVLTNAVNNGARAFAMSAPATNDNVSIEDSGDPCKFAAQTVQNAAGTLTTSSLTYTINYTTYLGSTTSSGTTTTYTGTGSSLPSCAGLKMYQMDVVQIQAVYPVSPVLYGWAAKTLSLTAQSSEMVQ